MVGTAAGLAAEGFSVFIYSIVPFVTMRCFEQIRVDVCYPRRNVNIVGVGGGLSYGSQGVTHHSIEDVAVMRALPGMMVMSPGDPIEVDACVRAALAYTGPAYIRLGKNGEPTLHQDSLLPEDIGVHCMRQGDNVAVLATGTMVETALEASELLLGRGVTVSVWSVPVLKPVPYRRLEQALGGAEVVYTLEEHSVVGGLGSLIAEFIAAKACHPRLRMFGIPDQYAEQVGSQAYLRSAFGLSARQIADQIAGDLARNGGRRNA